MREIEFRFRLKCKCTGKVLTVCIKLNDDKNGLIQYPIELQKWEILSIEQFTGLTDKNGKKIFEGDIIDSCNDGSDGCDIWEYGDFTPQVVRWNNKYCCFNGLPDIQDGDNSVHSLCRIEVVRNIHE